MTKGTRDDWELLLPVLTAFVSGQEVQRKEHTGRWVSTETMVGLLTGSQYRVKPSKSLSGEWTRRYRYIQPGSVSGPIGTGVMSWKGWSTDTPEWPLTLGFEYLEDPVFEPDLDQCREFHNATLLAARDDFDNK